MFAIEDAVSAERRALLGGFGADERNVFAARRAEARLSGVVETDAAPAIEETEDAPAQEERPAPFSVDLIPGSNRLVTSIMSPLDGSVMFRIPSWWADGDGAPEPARDKTYA